MPSIWTTPDLHFPNITLPKIHTFALRVRMLRSLGLHDADNPPLPAKEIVERISVGEWTASEVLEAYISRAVLAQNTTNCLTEG